MHKLRSNPVTRLMNRFMSARARRGGGRAMGMNLLVLHTIGRKSGQPRQSPVGWFPDSDDNAWLISASAAGADANPDWYHNLMTHPDQAAIELADRGTVAVDVEELTGADRDAAWQRILSVAPRFGSYEKKTDRIIPVIRLTARR
ncbi:nitroreductase family deazaflavin-dependent oxidoreductase [Nocardia sp. NPDC052112]|uniref:nitroreductase family deazaflavin-dependent oxidoreductase n=1 Tax=Nocardia sp. NPDC052112 TaxID=3155646 RepID=UPI00341B58CA